MEKINAMDVRKSFGEILSRTKLRGEEFIIEKGGKPTAVILPFHKAKLLKENAWKALLDTLNKTSSADLSDEEANELANEAIHKTR